MNDLYLVTDFVFNLANQLLQVVAAQFILCFALFLSFVNKVLKVFKRNLMR